MTFLSLIADNLRERLVRTSVTAVAVAIGVTAVMTLGVLTSSLRSTAVSILRTGKADFSLSQQGVADILASAVDESEVAEIRRTAGVESAVGVFVGTAKLDAEHPFFIEIGIAPAEQRAFGVTVVEGRSYRANAPSEMMLGWRAAKEFGLGVGDTMSVEDRDFRIVGLYSTGVVFGDLGGMFAKPTLQEWHRQPGVVTLVFVQAQRGTSIERLRSDIEDAHPHLVSAQSASDYGRVDRNLVLISAANLGGSILALFIGATGVMNTALLSFYERLREFGVLRAIGWSRRRLFGLVVGEALLVSLIGAGIGIGIGFGVVAGLERLPDLRGVFAPEYDAGIFARALAFAFGMALLGAIVPATKAARLAPMAALRQER